MTSSRNTPRGSLRLVYYIAGLVVVASVFYATQSHVHTEDPDGGAGADVPSPTEKNVISANRDHHTTDLRQSPGARTGKPSPKEAASEFQFHRRPADQSECLTGGRCLDVAQRRGRRAQPAEDCKNPNCSQFQFPAGSAFPKSPAQFQRTCHSTLDGAEVCEDIHVSSFSSPVYDRQASVDSQDRRGSSSGDVKTKQKVVPKIIIAGPPASGKGTQCEHIVERFNVVHISTGHLLRAEIAAKSPLGRLADPFVRSGDLVPDALVIEMVKNRLDDDDVRSAGWLLDGFPRTEAQARALTKSGIVAHAMVLLQVPDEVLIGRVEGRRVDPVTGKTYHMTFKPPPEIRNDGSDEDKQNAALVERLVQRSDDTRAAMVRRLKTFHANTDGIVKVYRGAVIRADGNRHKDDVGAEVVAALEEQLRSVGALSH